MLRHLTSLSVIALLAVSAPVLAQDDTSETPQTENEQQDDTNPDAGSQGNSQLDLGQAVNDGEAQLGERYSKQKFGDWDLACIRTEAEQDPCSLLQILQDEQGNSVAEISLFRLEGQGQAVAGATVVVPLETLLTAQLTIAVDGGTGKRYNYSFCNPIGCVAQIGLTNEDINSFKRGNRALVTLVPAPAPDQKVELSLSLTGFTAGYDQVDVVSN
ncbi:invasion associated locus B family protein [Thalassococcus sp. S3]|uniref:invasion associated locus B family protein n=1 Tax=Thalassococcus sp. S3 TaxID=2017482 RepID=UPI001023FDF2|nr:invasion associated locus B family protein [Thalassococcus sp. S3]QBF31866.1 invasion-associated locus B family protein [Thalassococcus sp. S3]